MGYVLGVVVDVTSITLIFALAAFGLAIIYGLIGVLNMGHGAMLTLGAYFAWWATSYGVPFLLAVVIAGAGVGIIGLVFEHVLIRHFYDKPFDTLLLTWAFFLVATEVIKISFGSGFHNMTDPIPMTFDLGTVHVPLYRTIVAGCSLLLLVVAGAILFRSSAGLKVRALVQNKEAATLLGLNVNRTYKTVFFTGSVIAGVSGALIAPMLSVNPYFGNVYLVRSFFVVLVGGLGQVLGGTLIGSFLTGGTETLFSLFSSQAVAQTLVFALAIVVLRFRPNGVLGGNS